MPAIYAHRRFGQNVLNLLPAKECEVILRNRQLYDIGLHGPDILFYYRPVSKNPVTSEGNRAHTVPGRIYLAGMWNTVRGYGFDGPYLSYFYGFICHYILDSACHGYINETSRTTPFSHSVIETELDRLFLLKDGLDPMRYKTASHLHATRANAGIVSSFFPDISEHKILESLRTMILIENLWIASSPAKRNLVNKAVKAIGMYDYASGLMRQYEIPSGCGEFLNPIIDMYNRAVRRAVRVIPSFADMVSGIKPIDPFFDLPFDPQNAADAPCD